MADTGWIVIGVVAGAGVVALAIVYGWRRLPNASDDDTDIATPQSAERDPKLDGLWKYLETFRPGELLPIMAEIFGRFGRPSSEYDPQLVASALSSSSTAYYRFTEADRASSSVEVKAWRYEYKGMEDELPSIEIYVRKSDNVVVGWEWTWMEPPGGNGIEPPL